MHLEAIAEIYGLRLFKCFGRNKKAASLEDDTFYLLSPVTNDTEELGLRREAMFSLLNV